MCGACKSFWQHQAFSFPIQTSISTVLEGLNAFATKLLDREAEVNQLNLKKK